MFRTKNFILFFFFVLLLSSITAQTVYKTKTGKKYHVEDCRYLSKSSIEISLKDAINEGLTPCSKCNPPQLTELPSESKNIINEKSTEVTLPKTDTPKKTTSSGRCQATTKKGTQCKRNAAPGSNYCWQHNR